MLEGRNEVQGSAKSGEAGWREERRRSWSDGVKEEGEQLEGSGQGGRAHHPACESLA